MAQYETEEQQVKAIKDWWKENGRSVIAGVVIGVAGIVGWKGWNAYQEQQSLAASDRYHAMRASILAQDLESVVQQAGELRDKYSSTPYASLGALLLAKAKAEQGDQAGVVENLVWVIGNSKQDTLQAVAKLRLARVYIAQNELDKAQGLLDQEYPQAYQSLRAEIRGDLLVGRGERAAARNAYDEAITTAGEEDVDYLRMKRDSLGITSES